MAPPSNFETLIEEMFKRTGPEGEAPAPSHQFSIDSLEAAWELAANSRRPPRPIGGGEAEPRLSPYGYGASEPAHDVSLDASEIVFELGLSPDASEADVVALRRQFALRNHPDRVPADLRDVATQRMMIANDLIDRYVAKLRRAPR